MKKYKKPVVKAIDLKDELLLGPVVQSVGDGELSKRNSVVTDDEYLGDDISYNKGIFRSAEENSDDATVVNHY